jgi:geranylgeranyl pyrophosphate synthase
MTPLFASGRNAGTPPSTTAQSGSGGRDLSVPGVSTDALVASVNDRFAPAVAGIDEPHLRGVAEYATDGGKRIRPLLTLLTCAAAGGDPLDALDGAVACELLHTASLLHDDIMDRAEMRRGRRTVHTLYDTPTAILAGDAIIALAFRHVHRLPAAVREPCVRLFIDGFLALCEGQSHDLQGAAGMRHATMVEKKTARLLEVCTALGGTVAGADPAVILRLRLFGRNLGMAFQAVDDLLDVTGTEESTGKTVAADARNGRATYLTAGRTGADSLERVRATIADYTDAAVRAVGSLPQSGARESLLRIAVELLGRTS